MKTPIKRAVAVTLLLVLLISGLPWSGIVPAATAETEPVEATEAPEPIPASETAVSDAPTEPPVEVEEAAPTEAAIALQPAETVEPLALNPSQDARILASGNGGYLYRSGTVGSGYYIFPSASASSTTFSWNYANGAGKSTVFGEDSPSILHYMNDVKTAPTTVFEAPVAYCLEPELGTVNEQLYEGLSPAQSTIWNSLLSPAQQSAIQVAGTYGWPNGFSDRPNGDMNKDGDTAFQYQFATQIIIWEIVMGLRSSTGQYALTNNSLKNIYYTAPQYGSHADFRAAYDEIDARIARHNSYPSFAAASASAAPVHRMDYNSSTGRYTLTLIDSNQILGQDYNQFAAPSGVTISQNGNTLTITATAAALSSGAVLISGTGKKLAVAPSTQKVWQYIKDDGSHRQTLMTIGNGGQAAAYFKLKADTKTVSLKKVSSSANDPNVIACIYGDENNRNPLYTLAGAKYEIRQGSPTGTVMETLTTDANGNASGTVKYNVGTVLYAVETVAPSGYLLNTDPVSLTVSASGNNVFNVSDKPTFDPRDMEIKKTGSDGEYIQGAVFKVDFYASNWMDSTQLKRTWYFQSDADGYVKFDDAHLLFSYNGHISSALYKPNGGSIMKFPLGCVYVEEVKAADGYILPGGGTGGVCIFIRQGGTQIAQNGKPAGAYWGDGGANPINTTNPKGIYKMENDSEKQTITAVNESSPGTMTMKKSLPAGYTGSLENYRFALSRNEDGSLWVGRSDANGNIYKTDNQYSIISDASKRVYTFDGLKDGTYTFREKLDGVNAKPTKIRFYTSGGITPSVEHTYTGSDITFSDGDCVIGGIVLTGLNGGGNLTIEIENTPFVYGEPFELVKIDPSDVKLSGAIFKVDYFNDGWFNQDELKKTWYFETDDDGYFTLDNAHLLPTVVLNGTEHHSDTLFEAGKIPLGIMRVTEVKAPEGFKPVQMIGAWRMKKSGTDQSKAECYWAAADGYTPTTSYGDEAYTLDADPTRLYVKDTPIYGNIELTKVDKDYPDHKLTGAEFTVTMTKGGNSETAVMTEVLDENGKGIGVYVLEHIEYGTVCEIQETKAPEGYVLSDEVFTVTINEEKTYKVGNGAYDCVTNKQIEGSIVMHKVDAEGQTLQGVKFLLEYSVDEGASWSPVLYRNADAPTQIGGCISEGLENGILTTDEDGCVAYTGLAVNTQYGKVVYRVTELETLPGYEMLTDAIYVGELAGDKVDLAFTVVNHKSFDMPMTGSKGFTASGIGLGLCVLAALFILFNLPQKRKNDKN